MSKNPSPTHFLKALDKITGHKTSVGVAWANPNGSFSIVLNPCVVLTPTPNIVITLFPNDRDEPKESQSTTTG